VTLDAEDRPGADQPTLESEDVQPDPCGCTTGPDAHGGETMAPAPTEPGEGSSVQASTNRTVKLVAVLRPSGTGFQAQLAAGADGCDPERRVVHVPDVTGALMGLREVLFTAQNRWHMQPRYPSTPRTSAPPHSRPGTTVSNPPAGQSRAEIDRGPERQRAAIGPQSNPPEGDQLSLFG
jgi:hypothetical protein